MVHAMRKIPSLAPYKKGDVMVVFGELFNRGYANGIVDEANKIGMKVVHTTVGRREGTELRPLNAEELAGKPQPFINVPLEAGFDMEPDSKGISPADQLKGYKMSQWQDIKLDWGSIEESRVNGVKRFIKNLEAYLKELEAHIPEGANVLFVHTMAGGVPRSKILMPVMNKVFKGRGDRFSPSEGFLNSELGKFSCMNFDEVTANTFKHLVEQTEHLRKKIQSTGANVSYVAYGYHGTDVLQKNEYKWQTYTPYFQGWAKIKLEDHAKDFHKQGIKACIYNCPEILTDSSSIFQGVEVSLYPLVGALKKEASAYNEKILKKCKGLIKDEHSFDEIMDFTADYFQNELTTSHSLFEQWPQHNSKDQMGYMLTSSDHLISMHKDPKDLMTFPLSEEVFKSTGNLMFHDSWDCMHPVQWLGHDIIAKQMATNNG